MLFEVALRSLSRLFSILSRSLHIENMKILNVAEKNDAAKNIAQFLSGGRSRRREGFSKFNKIYEFDYRIFGQNATMVMTSVSGHLLSMDFIGSYKSWQSCHPISLFSAPVFKTCPLDYQNIKKTLEREIRSCNKLIIWTDCDREGENIGFEIIEVCKQIKPDIAIHRAKFSEITAPSVTRACQNLILPDANVSNAVDVRQELDLRIGASFTRFQTLRLKKVFPESLANTLISYGSCQFPTLGFVVERFKAVNSFIPEPFWKIQVLHCKDSVTTEFLWKTVRLFNEMACLVRFKMCTENPTATVTDVSSKPKRKWRPLPLDTVEFEKLSSRKLRIGAKEAMTVAERLYTKGFISYPRTETNIFPKEMNLRDLVQLQVEDPQWGAFAERVLADGPNPRQGTKSDKAHPPIHPIKHTNGLQGNEQRLYELIVRHFLACLSKDAEGHETTVEIDIAKEQFTAKGLMILAKNYLEVYPYERWTDKEMATYCPGEQFIPSEINMNDGETNAPPLLTEADLIALMEKHGIGTDATHADHIETIKSRSYVGMENNYFLPGTLGMGLVEGYDAMGFHMSKPHLRAELEADLKRISEGQKDPKVVLEEQIARYKEVFIKASDQVNKLDEKISEYMGLARQGVPAEEPVENVSTSPMKCRKCGFDMMLKQTRDGNRSYVGCMNFPACKGAIWLPESISNVVVSDSICDECTPRPVLKLTFTFRRGYEPRGYPAIYTGCIGGCDLYFNDSLGIQLPSASTNVSAASTIVGTHNGGGDQMLNATPVNFTRTQPVRDLEQNLQTTIGMDKPKCNCGADALQLVTRKEGPNKGRPFFKCGNQANACNYFKWADEMTTSAVDNTNKRPRVNGSVNISGITCSCGQPAKKLTVANGPNTGREFLVCPNPRDQQCKFFKWADDATLQNGQGPPAMGRGNTNGNYSGRGRQNGNVAGGRITSGRGAHKVKCSICHQEGHNKRSCPNKQ